MAMAALGCAGAGMPTNLQLKQKHLRSVGTLILVRRRPWIPCRRGRGVAVSQSQTRSGPSAVRPSEELRSPGRRRFAACRGTTGAGGCRLVQTAEVRGRGRQVPRSVVARAAVRRAGEDAPALGAWVLGGGERGGEPGAGG